MIYLNVLTASLSKALWLFYRLVGVFMALYVKCTGDGYIFAYSRTGFGSQQPMDYKDTRRIVNDENSGQVDILRYLKPGSVLDLSGNFPGRVYPNG